jgi:UDP-2,4-diacetamido-2,4,6-trideoxy-beta-L-altropyranose hydrolase
MPRATDGKLVALRRMIADDVLTLYDWQQHPETRRFARNPQPPELEQHKKWFFVRLASDDCVLWMILCDGEAAGMLRFERGPGEHANAWEVSILVAPDKKDRGVAAAALALGRQTMPSAEFVAEVLPGNEASHRLFRNAGYVLGSDGLYHSPPKL